MDSLILYNGYYLSESQEWTDSHAGHKFEGRTFTYLKLNSNKSFIIITRNHEDFNFQSFLQDTSKFDLENDTSVILGNFTVADEKSIICNFNVWGEKKEIVFHISSSHVIIANDVKEYTFKPFQ